MPRPHKSPAQAIPAGSAPLFAALGDENRLRLVSRLSSGRSMSISRLTAGSNVTRQAITKHLRVMEKAGLVWGTRCGRESVWQLDRRRLDEARRHLEQISRHWDEALARLQAAVELDTGGRIK